MEALSPVSVMSPVLLFCLVCEKNSEMEMKSSRAAGLKPISKKTGKDWAFQKRLPLAAKSSLMLEFGIDLEKS